MSHFTKIKTQFTNKTYLLQALRALGFDPRKAMWPSTALAGPVFLPRFAFPPRPPATDVGFRRAGPHYVCIADWFGVHGISSGMSFCKL